MRAMVAPRAMGRAMAKGMPEALLLSWLLLLLLLEARMALVARMGAIVNPIGAITV